MMNEPFLLPVEYKGEERAFEAELQVWGYGHRFQVNVDGSAVIFERDEEGSYRAVIPPETPGALPAAALLRAIAETIGRILA